MAAPSGLTVCLVVLMSCTACFHVGRMAVARRRRCAHRYDVDTSHALMGAAMVIMLVEPRAHDQVGLLALVTAVPAVWFGCQAVSRYVAVGVSGARQPARQALLSVAMLYMLVIATGSPTSSVSRPTAQMAGMAMAPGPSDGLVLLGPLVVLLLGGLTVWTASEIRGSVTARRTDVVAPVTSGCCQLAMTVTSGLMLVAML
jgi:hypothetical protein